MSSQTKQIILAVFVYHDDESSFPSGTIPKYVKQGVIVDLISSGLTISFELSYARHLFPAGFLTWS